MSPPTDVKEVVESEIKEWHFRELALTDRRREPRGRLTGDPADIYFHQRNADEHQAALELRDAVLRLRRDGAFVAVPLFRVNTDPIGPHPVGSYEIWCPSESFVSVYSYLCLNRGNLSVLIHPLTREEGPRDSSSLAWAFLPLGPLHASGEERRSSSPICQLECVFVFFLPSSFSLTLHFAKELGYSSTAPKLTLEERKRLGANVEQILKGEKEAAKAPSD
ncbi:hypothetical protein BN946_scf184940.g17 [Trametes cinnabarina]|uniref:DOPA 4,5-dioxygenase n=1 Tax=Pycnoporus cinnabarinus TaxID=5643 RepID=A0A060SBZ6_PYCCI|nr:hypothetical protein BN946_scf184940.g17 [Trametes cinnabarina]